MGQWVVFRFVVVDTCLRSLMFMDELSMKTNCVCSDLKPLLDNLGLYFQIRDDYANLYSMEVRTGE